MKESNHSGVEDSVIAILVVGISLTFLALLVLWKAVENEPYYYRNLRFKDSAKTSAWLAGCALALSGLLLVAPESGKYVIFKVSHFKFQSGIIISWFIAQLSLWAVSYLFVPIWAKYIPAKNEAKNQLY